MPNDSYLQLLGVDKTISEFISDQLGSLITIDFLESQEHFFTCFQSGGKQPDTVILGLDVEEPVQISQRIHTYDKYIPIIILSPANLVDSLKRTLMFSPFLGNEVIPYSVSDYEMLPRSIINSIDNRKKRTSYFNTINNAKIRLEKLPLLQPEATYYLDQLLDHAPIGVITVDLNGFVLTINSQAMAVLGVNERKILGFPLEAVIAEREKVRFEKLMRSSLEGQFKLGPDIFEIDYLNNSVLFLEIIIAPLTYKTGQKGAMVILQDVTDRTKAERERQRAENELRVHVTVLREFQQISSDLLLTLDKKINRILKLGCLQFKLPYALITKVDGDELKIQDSISDNQRLSANSTLNLEETYCGHALTFNQPLAIADVSKSSFINHACYVKHKLATYIGIKIVVNGKVYGTLCFMGEEPRNVAFTGSDLEIIKLMAQWVGSELQRRSAEVYMRKLSSALEQTADAVMITDRERRIEYVNPAFEVLTGYHWEDVVGHKTYFLRSGEHDDAFYKSLWETIEKGKVYRGILVNKKKDGSFFHEQKTITPLKDESGAITHFISTGNDITELVRAEEKDRLHQAELAHVGRLSVLGEMTSGLAHEINQPLCAITTYAQTCLRKIQSDSPELSEIRYGLEHVVRQAELGGAIFKRLRNFARKGELKKESIDIKDVIDEVEGFIRAEANQHKIKFQKSIPNKLPNVLVDPIQIEQVLLNLVRNSIDAMLTVGATSKAITVKASKDKAEYLKISLTDTGGGCTSEVADRLFVPFFTTKANGLGIGLGISQSIIDAHGGRLWLSKNSSSGATFSFTVPIDQGDST